MKKKKKRKKERKKFEWKFEVAEIRWVFKGGGEDDMGRVLSTEQESWPPSFPSSIRPCVYRVYMHLGGMIADWYAQDNLYHAPSLESHYQYYIIEIIWEHIVDLIV